MSILDVFSKKSRPPEPGPDIDAFLADRQEMGHHVFVLRRANGGRVALFLEPLRHRRNEYHDKVEDGVVTILVEDDPTHVVGEWFQGVSAHHWHDRSNPADPEPFAPGTRHFGGLRFTQVGKAAPFHGAHGLSWWSDTEGVAPFRSLLSSVTLPEARLIWQRYEPGNEVAEPVVPTAEIASMAGVWHRSHSVEGKLVVDPTEGCGFSIEGDEYWSEQLVVWEDGVVTVDAEVKHQGMVGDGTVEWAMPESDRAPDYTPTSIERFRACNGPVAFDGEALIVGGYKFERLADTESE